MGSVILEVAELSSPVGSITLAARDGRLCALGFTDHWPYLRQALQRRIGKIELGKTADPAGAVSRLGRYFRGDLRALDSNAVDPEGTAFQKRVWSELRKIPAGRTASYRDIARAIGAPKAVRAVGAANGQNPISIVIPCHRVIGADGDLSGYGGGIERKRWLLEHEGAIQENGRRTFAASRAVRSPTSS